jgi:hypothetical protein
MPLIRRISTWSETSRKFCRLQAVPHGYRVGALDRQTRRKTRDNFTFHRRPITSECWVNDDENVADLLSKLGGLLCFSPEKRGEGLALFDPQNRPVDGHTKMKTVRGWEGVPTADERAAEEARQEQIETATAMLEKLFAKYEDDCDDSDDYLEAILIAASQRYGKKQVQQAVTAL